MLKAKVESAYSNPMSKYPYLYKFLSLTQTLSATLTRARAGQATGLTVASVSSTSKANLQQSKLAAAIKLIST